MREALMSDVTWMDRVAAGTGLEDRAPTSDADVEVCINDVAASEFDRIVAAAADGSYEQTSVYAEACWGARTQRCLIRRRGQVLAGAIVAILTAPMLRQGLAYVKFGPFWRLGSLPRTEDYAAAIHALARHYCTDRGHHLSILPRPNPDYTAEEIAVLKRSGFRANNDVVDKNRYLVNVAQNADDLKTSLAQKWRYNLRQSIKNGVTVEHAENEASISAFQSMHRQMVVRKRFHDADAIELLPDMLSRLPATLAPRIYTASKDGTPVAGAVVGCLGDTAYYVFGSSTGEALPLKAGFALQWRIAQDLVKEPQIRWYDLGGEAMSPGLRQFKHGLVGRSGAIVEMEGEFGFWRPGLGHLTAAAIYAIRDVQRWLRKS